MIIDGHVHIAESWWPDDAFARLAEEGVDRVLGYSGVFPQTIDDAEVSRRNNDFLAGVRDADPDKVYPFATVHPRFGEAAAEELSRAAHELGMAGAAFNPQQQNFNVLIDLGHGPVLDALRELRKPILFDCDYLPYFSSPAQLAELSRRLPGIPIILGHFGWLNLWRMAIEVAQRNENLYLETPSAPPFAIREAVKRLGHERVIFGSDFPCDAGETVAYELMKIRELRLGDEAEEAVLGGNLERLLGEG